MPTRRRMLRASGVALSGAAAGALTVAQLSNTSGAADADLDVEGDSFDIRNGELAAVSLDVAVEWAYAVPSGERPATVIVELLAGDDADSLAVVDAIQTEEPFLEADGSESFSVDLLDSTYDAAALVPSEGETKTTTVHVGTEMRLLDENGLVIAADSASDTAELAVERSEYDPEEYGSVAGAGQLTIEIE